VVNFHDREQQVRVRIPSDAFIYLGMEEKPKATATDLLRGDKLPMSFVPDGTIELPIPAWRGVILRIK